jgi:hypothetical protein
MDSKFPRVDSPTSSRLKVLLTAPAIAIGSRYLHPSEAAIAKAISRIVGRGIEPGEEIRTGHDSGKSL